MELTIENTEGRNVMKAVFNDNNTVDIFARIETPINDIDPSILSEEWTDPHTIPLDQFKALFKLFEPSTATFQRAYSTTLDYNIPIIE